MQGVRLVKTPPAKSTGRASPGCSERLAKSMAFTQWHRQRPDARFHRNLDHASGTVVSGRRVSTSPRWSPGASARGRRRRGGARRWSRRCGHPPGFRVGLRTTWNVCSSRSACSLSLRENGAAVAFVVMPPSLLVETRRSQLAVFPELEFGPETTPEMHSVARRGAFNGDGLPWKPVLSQCVAPRFRTTC